MSHSVTAHDKLRGTALVVTLCCCIVNTVQRTVEGQSTTHTVSLIPPQECCRVDLRDIHRRLESIT